VLHRRQYDLKLAFNAAQFALTGCLATIVYHLLATPLGDAWSWVAQLAAVAVATITAALCIFAVMSLAEGRADVRPLLGMLGFSLPFTLGAAAVGVVVARTAVHDPAALALLMIPTLLIIAAYRAYTRAREQQENLKLLHEVTSLLHGDDVDAAMGDFLTSARTAFRASTAELVLVSSAGNGGMTVSRSQDGAEPVVMSVPEDAEEQERLLRLATAAGALATRTGTSRGGALDTYAAQRGFKDAMVAALRTEDRVHGLLLVAGRLGDVGTFNRSDLALLETFGRHVATSLERGRWRRRCARSPT
jgi:putative flippase GtrA